MDDAAEKRPLQPAWQSLSDHLVGMLNAVSRAQSGPLELNQFASRFLAMATSYHTAIQSAGKSSMRIRAMLKALDLRTPKSVVQGFLDDHGQQSSPAPKPSSIIQR